MTKNEPMTDKGGMKNPPSPLANPKYSPTGQGGSKSEGTISKSDKAIKFPDCCKM